MKGDTMKQPMMQCGHAASGTSQGEPVCVICAGRNNGWNQIVDTPNLEGREARCTYYRDCGKAQPSAMSLAFFGHHPKRAYDEFYCGCRGWD